MALILNIETATENASVCLCRDSEILAFEESADQKNHAAFLQPAIKRILSTVNLPLSSVDAIAVSNGPGSYTGLRVGLSTAKGLCYALNKPLILINTLEVMAHASIQNYFHLKDSRNDNKLAMLFCPMIDARRMEVFTALYDAQLNIIMEPCALILSEESFQKEMAGHFIIFSGSGSKKLLTHIPNFNGVIPTSAHNATHLAVLAHKAFNVQQFADLAYSEPYYIKAFYTPQK